ncbi:Neural cell adhesion molecule 1-A [Merluccius polli]|uniref:Neural cell adhesion molecule 1-A n=1 Tax=Merluccius polli TaxID=89951 RepID=A0AA47MQG5_MERPO|nr:Neural cell adhesion molecule 1-A [Merluccius polli]
MHPSARYLTSTCCVTTPFLVPFFPLFVKTLCISVVGDATDIDWYAPSGEKIETSQDILVSRTDESTSTLTIYHATVDSSGNYKCVAKSGDKEAQAMVQVAIFQKISFRNAPSLQEFNEGDSADIICDVVSSPPATIFWKHKGAKIHVATDGRPTAVAIASPVASTTSSQ